MNKNNIHNLKNLAEKYRIRKTERDGIYLNTIEIPTSILTEFGYPIYISPYDIIQNFIYNIQQKCKHEEIIYFEPEEKQYYKKYLSSEFFTKSKCECQFCGRIFFKMKNKNDCDPIRLLYTKFGSYADAVTLALQDHYIQQGSKEISNLPYELIKYGFNQDT